MLLNFSEKPNNASLLESVRNSLMPRRSKPTSQVEWEDGNWKLKPLLCLTFFCPLSENHVILTHQFPSCDIIESDTITVTFKWHRLCDDCRLMLMFVCPAHLFVLVLRSNSSQNHMKNPDTSEHICDTPVIASAEEWWYYWTMYFHPHSPLTYLHWPFCIIWHNFIYETNMPCSANQFLAISLRSNIWEYIEPVYNPNICNIIADLWS